jgi:hypothetical protein
MTGQLPELLRILWAARIDAAANKWHLVHRAVPTLTAIAEKADDDQLRQAVVHTSAALTQMDVMLESLRTAIDFIQPGASAGDQDRQTA